jgi:hypothetical protein
VSKCLECKKVKVEHRHPIGLQSLPLPECQWEVVTMDFITSSPRLVIQHIIVMVDKLTKATHFTCGVPW